MSTKNFKGLTSVLGSLIILASASPSLAAVASSTEVRSVAIDHIYAPRGFDNNDDTQVVVTGNLPNHCYSSPKGKFIVNDHRVELSVSAYFDKTRICLEALVPFTEVVSLGQLKFGTYDVFSRNQRVTIKSTFDVALRKSPNTDDHLYAHLDTIISDDGDSRITLKGYNPSDCYELDRVQVVSNGVDTYSILPIMKQIRDRCPLKMTPISIPVDLPNELKVNEVLLHTRTMNGQSLNKIHRTR